MTEKKTTKGDFEKSLARLREIEQEITGPDVKIEDAFKLVEEAENCYKNCRQIIDGMEQKITQVDLFHQGGGEELD